MTQNRSKAPNYILRPTMRSFETPSVPWQRIIIDFLAEYSRSKTGQKYIMVILDHLIKFIIINYEILPQNPQYRHWRKEYFISTTYLYISLVIT